MVAAPVAVGANAEKMYVGVMLQRDPQTQRLYLHDAVAEKEPASQTGGHLSTTGPGGSESELYTTNILRNDLNVKKNNEGSSTRRTLHADVTQSTKSGESNAQPSTNSIRSGNEKNKSRPVWGAWIEIALPPDSLPIPRVAPRIGWLFTGHCLPVCPGISLAAAFSPRAGWRCTCRNRTG